MPLINLFHYNCQNIHFSLKFRCHHPQRQFSIFSNPQFVLKTSAHEQNWSRKNHLNETAHEKLVCSLTVHTLPASIIYFGCEELKLSKEYNSSQRHAMHLGMAFDPPPFLIFGKSYYPQTRPTLYFDSQITLTNRSVIKSDKRGHVQKAKGRYKRKVRQRNGSPNIQPFVCNIYQ